MASYTTDRPASPSFVQLGLKPFQSTLAGADVPKTYNVFEAMASDGSSSIDNVASTSTPVLPTGTSSETSGILDVTSPELLAHIVNTWRGLGGNGTASSLREPYGNENVPRGGSGTGGDAALLAIEKRRHDETKRLLADTESRNEKLIKELLERNEDLEDYRIDVRDLKDQLKAADVQRDSMHKRLTELAEVEQEVADQADTIHALRTRLRIEMEDRRKVDSELVDSHLAHAKDIHSFENERKAHAAAAAVSAQQQDQIRKLQEQLDEANKRVAARDRKLADAEAEKRALQATIFDARNDIEETAAVFGEASLAFNSEVDRVMSTLRSMKLSTAPRPLQSTAAQQPLPPWPPRR